ncbi:hypothetical protein AWENTII_006383 [Aspergillus wentii]|nr:hypothetical protein MW887_003176 [Aspergillus wentii]
MIDALEELTGCTGKCYEDAMHRAAVCTLCDKMGEMVHRVYQKGEYGWYDGVSGISVRQQAARLKEILEVIVEMVKRSVRKDDEDEVLALKMMEGLNGWRFVDMIV